MSEFTPEIFRSANSCTATCARGDSQTADPSQVQRAPSRLSLTLIICWSPFSNAKQRLTFTTPHGQPALSTFPRAEFSLGKSFLLLSWTPPPPKKKVWLPGIQLLRTLNSFIQNSANSCVSHGNHLPECGVPTLTAGHQCGPAPAYLHR